MATPEKSGQKKPGQPSGNQPRSDSGAVGNDNPAGAQNDGGAQPAAAPQPTDDPKPQQAGSPAADAGQQEGNEPAVTSAQEQPPSPTTTTITLPTCNEQSTDSALQVTLIQPQTICAPYGQTTSPPPCFSTEGNQNQNQLNMQTFYQCYHTELPLCNPITQQQGAAQIHTVPACGSNTQVYNCIITAVTRTPDCYNTLAHTCTTATLNTQTPVCRQGPGGTTWFTDVQGRNYAQPYPVQQPVPVNYGAVAPTQLMGCTTVTSTPHTYDSNCHPHPTIGCTFGMQCHAAAQPQVVSAGPHCSGIQTVCCPPQGNGGMHTLAATVCMPTAPQHCSGIQTVCCPPQQAGNQAQAAPAGAPTHLAGCTTVTSTPYTYYSNCHPHPTFGVQCYGAAAAQPQMVSAGPYCSGIQTACCSPQQGDVQAQAQVTAGVYCSGVATVCTPVSAGPHCSGIHTICCQQQAAGAMPQGQQQQFHPVNTIAMTFTPPCPPAGTPANSGFVCLPTTSPNCGIFHTYYQC